jgi:membrane protein
LDSLLEFLRFVRRIVGRIAGHNILGRGAEVAFFFLIAVFPSLLAIIGILSFLNLDPEIETLRSVIRQGAPSAVADLILGEIGTPRPWRGWTLFASLVLTVYYASFGVASVTRGVKRAWEVESTELRIRLLGFGLAGFMIAAAPIVVILLAAVSWVILWANKVGIVPTGFAYAVIFLRWPILFILFQQATNLVYRAAARKACRWGWISWGSVFASLSWVVITELFERFVAGVTNLGAWYGSLGTGVALLIYAHFLAMATLLGAEIDAELGTDRKPQSA